MKILKIVRQNRRDFHALYECESCGNVVEQNGYDDRNFHDNVLPTMKCTKCGKSRNDIGIVGEFTETRYAEGYQI